MRTQNSAVPVWALVVPLFLGLLVWVVYTRSQQHKTVQLLFVGDVMLSRKIGEKVQNDPSYDPFEYTHVLLATADIRFANLENPIIQADLKDPYSLKLNAPSRAASLLKAAGFDVLSLANNHITDFGDEGVRSTTTELDRTGLKHVGGGLSQSEARNPVIVTKNGISVAYLAYTDTRLSQVQLGEEGEFVADMDIEKMKLEVSRAKKITDVVIVYMHAGTEYSSVVNDTQKNFAHAAIDAGADVVVGSHPHVVQASELYKHGLIFYSLGNFVFDQKWNEEVRKGEVVRLEVGSSGVKSYVATPIRINDLGQPTIVEK